MKFKFKTVLLLSALLSTSIQASEVATFGKQLTQSQVETTTAQQIQTQDTTLVQVGDVKVPAYIENLQQTGVDEETPTSVFVEENNLNTLGNNKSLVISTSELWSLYNQRMASGIASLPIRYLPYGYDADYHYMNIADNLKEITVAYQVIDGYPIFYQIRHYIKPETKEAVKTISNDTGASSKVSGNFGSRTGTLSLD